MEKNYGPLWQLEQNIEAKKLLIKTYTDDIERFTKKRAQIINELAEYEQAIQKLAS